MSVTPFNPQNLQETLKARVKAIFGELIPDDQWEHLLRKETDLYIREDLPKVIKMTLHNEAVRIVKDWVRSADWQMQFSPDGLPRPRAIFLEVVEQNPQKFMSAMLAGMMDQMLTAGFQSAANSLQQHNMQYHPSGQRY